MQKNSFTRLILVLTILAATSLACSLPGLAGSSAPTLPPTVQPMNTEQVQNLENQLQATLANPNPSGEVTVTLSQEQINGMITSQMAQQPDQVISDPSVILTGGHMEVYGKVTQSGISANLKAVLQPQVDASGAPHLNIVSMTLGGLPVPDVLKNRIATMADDALNSYLEGGSNKFKVNNITINEGSMTVTGTRQ